MFVEDINLLYNLIKFINNYHSKFCDEEGREERPIADIRYPKTIEDVNEKIKVKKINTVEIIKLDY